MEKQNERNEPSLLLRAYLKGSKVVDYYRDRVQTASFVSSYTEQYPKYLLPEPQKADEAGLPSLPIEKHEKTIVRAVSDRRVVVVVGSTGSGKTTRVPVLLTKHFGSAVVCTQPRKLAAVSVAHRVSWEQQRLRRHKAAKKTSRWEVGKKVGYAVRFENRSGTDTKVKYCTEGVLANELESDPLLTRYAFVVVDEAHERTTNTDLLLGALKVALRRNRKLSVVVMSATLDASKFSAFFWDAPIVTVQSKTFPVQIEYLAAVPTDPLETALLQLLALHASEPAGDFLLFVAGQEEAEALCQLAFERSVELYPENPLVLLPLYSALPQERQQLVFRKFSARKCVVATNVAETSLTVEGVVLVLDLGICKQKGFRASVGSEFLRAVCVSKQSAVQRAGRAGRTQTGKCLRLYQKELFDLFFAEETLPEVLRTDLSAFLLRLKRLGFTETAAFPLLDRPDKSSLETMEKRLTLDGTVDSGGKVTRLGCLVDRLPLNYQLALLVAFAAEQGVARAGKKLAAVLSAENLLFDSPGSSRFANYKSDHLTLLSCFEAWLATPTADFCKQHRVNFRAVQKAEKIWQQLESVFPCNERNKRQDETTVLRFCLARSFQFNLCRLKGNRNYENVRSCVSAKLHPTSVLNYASAESEFLVCSETKLGKQNFFCMATEVEGSWFELYSHMSN